MPILAQLGCDAIARDAMITTIPALLGVCVGHVLAVRQSYRDSQKNARYRLLVILKQMQLVIATAVDRAKRECGSGTKAGEHYNDMVLKLALGETIRPLQDAVLDTLRKHDGLPELKEVRRALWCPGAGAERWLVSLAKGVSLLEERVCPKLKKCEDEIYKEQPEEVRRIIEHTEERRNGNDGSDGSSG